jgi:hypothetical protein
MLQNTVILEVGKSRTLSGVLFNSQLTTGPYVPVTMLTLFSKYTVLHDYGTKVQPTDISWSVDQPTVLSLVQSGQDCEITGLIEGIAIVTCTILAPVARATTVRVIVLPDDAQPTLIIVAGPMNDYTRIE